MIGTELLSEKALRLTPSGKLGAADFRELAPQLDGLIAKFGSIRLVIDVYAFSGWDSFAGFEAHAGFIRAHQANIERLAAIVGHEWQHWLVETVRLVLHPQARAFDRAHEAEALDWIRAP